MVFAACTQRNDSVSASSSEAEAQSATEVKEDNTAIEQEITSRVNAIYEYVARVYAPGAPEGTDVDLNKKYGSRHWNELVEAITLKDSKIDGIGFWEADPWIMGQDCDKLFIDNLSVTSIDGDKASAAFKLHNLGSVTPVVVKLVKENDQWMIDDLIDSKDSFSWQEAMQSYLAE